MWIYLSMTLLTIAGAYCVNNRYDYKMSGLVRQKMLNQILLLAIFMGMFLVAAFRINVGNDYAEYLAIFGKITRNQQVSSEFGFNAIVRVFQWLFGAGTYLPIFAFFSGVTIAFMLKALYDQCDCFWYGFFLFMMSAYYFSALNTVRYYFAFAIALYAAKYAIKRDYARFILWILLAATVHKTVLIVIPIYLFATRQWKKIEIGVILAFCASLIMFQDWYQKLIFLIYPYYENSAFDKGSISYLNILKCLCVLLFALLYYKQAIKDNRQNLFYFYLNLGAILLYTFCSFIPEVSRLGYYMVGFQSILLANIIAKMKDKRQKIFFGVLIGIAFALYFAIFMVRAGGIELRIVPYQSWLFHGLE